MSSEQYIYSRNKMYSYVEVVRTYNLVLDFGFVLNLEQTFLYSKFG